jgi:hypothetical protein
MGDYTPKQIGVGQTLFQTNLEHLVAETHVSADEMRDWNKAGLLSFWPEHRAEYEEAHVAEVRFIASLMRSGLSRAMVSKMLRTLPRPYRYDPERTSYNFATREWQHIPAPPF